MAKIFFLSAGMILTNVSICVLAGFYLNYAEKCFYQKELMRQVYEKLPMIVLEVQLHNFTICNHAVYTKRSLLAKNNFPG